MKLPIMSASPQGLCTALAPDMCLTFVGLAAVPLPYPNVARCGDGQGSSKVSVDGKEVMRVGDKIARSTGDEAGNAPGGIVSGSFAGKAAAQQTPQTSVKAEGKAVMVQGGMTGQNSFSPPNTAGGNTKAAQGKAWIRPTFGKGYGRGEEGSPLDDAMEVMVCSSALYQQLNEFAEMGGKIKYGNRTRLDIDSPRWYECSEQKSKMTITIDRNLRDNPHAIVSNLAFELGRALEGHPNILYEPGMSEKEFVAKNLKRKLFTEAKGHWNQSFIRDQIWFGCREEIGNLGQTPDGKPSHEFIKAYKGWDWEEWKQDGMSWKPDPEFPGPPYQARLRRMADLAAEQPCPGAANVRDYYENQLKGVWQYHDRYFGRIPNLG